MVSREGKGDEGDGLPAVEEKLMRAVVVGCGGEEKGRLRACSEKEEDGGARGCSSGVSSWLDSTRGVR